MEKTFSEPIIEKTGNTRKGTALKSRYIEIKEEVQLICQDDFENFSIEAGEDSEIWVKFGLSNSDFMPLTNPISYSGEKSGSIILQAKGSGFLKVMFGDNSI